MGGTSSTCSTDQAKLLMLDHLAQKSAHCYRARRDLPEVEYRHERDIIESAWDAHARLSIAEGILRGRAGSYR